MDDVILGGNNKGVMQWVKNYLDKKFSFKDLGLLKYFLGIEVARSSHCIVLSQRKYVLDILKEMGMQACRPSKFPMEQNCNLKGDSNAPIIDVMRYRRLVGRLLYLTVTRPKITYAVNTLCQFMTAPKQVYMDAVERVLRYLKSTPGQGILLSSSGELKLESYCDADWGGRPFTRRSCTGYLAMLGGSPISRRTKR